LLWVRFVGSPLEPGHFPGHSLDLFETLFGEKGIKLFLERYKLCFRFVIARRFGPEMPNSV
jgi:hypothetical protein